MIETREQRLNRIYGDVQYGLPIDQRDTRWLVEQLSGRSIPRRRRCRVCDGLGSVRRTLWPFEVSTTCAACAGSGYTSAEQLGVG